MNKELDYLFNSDEDDTVSFDWGTQPIFVVGKTKKQIWNEKKNKFEWKEVKK